MADEPKAASTGPKYDQVTTLFADGLYGASVISGTVRIDLAGLVTEHGRADGGNTPVPMVVGRLVMPVERLPGFVQGLNEIVKRLTPAAATATTDKPPNP